MKAVLLLSLILIVAVNCQKFQVFSYSGRQNMLFIPSNPNADSLFVMVNKISNKNLCYFGNITLIFFKMKSFMAALKIQLYS